MSKVLDDIISKASLEEVTAMADLGTVMSVIDMVGDLSFRYPEMELKIKSACIEIANEIRTQV